MNPPSNGPTAAATAAAAPHHGVDLLLCTAFEVAVDERLHGRQEQRRTDPAHDGPEDDHGRQALGQRHRQRPDGVPAQSQHVGALAPDQVPHLAADQDERGRDQGLQRDRGLDAADRRAQIPDHCRDRHVHDRRVDHEHEHGHRQQQGQTTIKRRVHRTLDVRCLCHLDASPRPCLVVPRSPVQPGRTSSVKDGASRGGGWAGPDLQPRGRAVPERQPGHRDRLVRPHGYENGDECAYVYGATQGAAGKLYNQVIRARHYLTQEEFSNRDFVATGAAACRANRPPRTRSRLPGASHSTTSSTPGPASSPAPRKSAAG